METCASLLEKMRTNAFQKTLARLYCCPPDETDVYAERYALLLTAFAAQFGPSEGVRLVSSPGRTEVGGNHTDHQHGCIVAGSVTLDIAAVAAPNGMNVVRMVSDAATVETISLGSLAPDPHEKFRSSALIRGIASRFSEAGLRVGGFDVMAASTVLNGSGLSSSAAFEILIGVIFNTLYCDGAVSPVRLAQFGQYAENVYFGKPSGLMDQLASSVGGMLFVDFADPGEPKVEKIDFNLAAYGHALCIVDSGADHADLSAEYATIPEEMGRVAVFFGKTHLRDVPPTDFINSIPQVRKGVGDRAFLRALHFFNENQRAINEAEALKSGDFDRFLRLVRASGESSALYLQNIHVSGAEREQAMDVALAVCAQSLQGRGAYRVHGGGFAGTVQAFVPADMLDAFVLEIDAALGRNSCHVLSIRPDGGFAFA